MVIEKKTGKFSGGLMKDIMKELKKKHRFYLQGKSMKGIRAAIEYLESEVYKTQNALALKYGVTTVTIGKRVEEIADFLNLNVGVIVAQKPVVDGERKLATIPHCFKCHKKLRNILPRYIILRQTETNTRGYYRHRTMGYLCEKCYSEFFK